MPPPPSSRLRYRNQQQCLPGSSYQHSESDCLVPKKADCCDCLNVECPGCFLPCPKCRSNKCGVVCRVGRSWNYVKEVHRDRASDWQEWWLLVQLQLHNPTLLCTVYLWGTLLYLPVTSFCITNAHTSLLSALTVSSLHPVSQSQQLQSHYSMHTIIIHLSLYLTHARVMVHCPGSLHHHMQSCIPVVCHTLINGQVHVSRVNMVT